MDFDYRGVSDKLTVGVVIVVAAKNEKRGVDVNHVSNLWRRRGGGAPQSGGKKRLRQKIQERRSLQYTYIQVTNT